MTMTTPSVIRAGYCELCNAKDAPVTTKYGAACRPCAKEIAREDRGFNPTTGWN